MLQGNKSDEKIISEFKGVIGRCKRKGIIRINDLFIVVLEDDTAMMVKIGKELLNELLIDMKDELIEFDMTNQNHTKYNDYLKYTEERPDDIWIGMDSNKLYAGEMINITVDDLHYKIPINKNSFPIKLRKAEFSDIDYRIQINPDIVFIIRKQFKKEKEDVSFSIFKIYRVL